jgi:hypothetical protein
MHQLTTFTSWAHKWDTRSKLTVAHHLAVGDSLMAGQNNGGSPIARSIRQFQRYCLRAGIDYEEFTQRETEFLRARTISASDFLNFAADGTLPQNLFPRLNNRLASRSIPLDGYALQEIARALAGVPEVGIKPNSLKAVGLAGYYLIGTFRAAKHQLKVKEPSPIQKLRQKDVVLSKISRPGARLSDLSNETFDNYDGPLNLWWLQFLHILYKNLGGPTYLKEGLQMMMEDAQNPSNFDLKKYRDLLRSDPNGAFPLGIVSFIENMASSAWTAKTLIQLQDDDGNYITQLAYLKLVSAKLAAEGASQPVWEITSTGNDFITGILFDGNETLSDHVSPGDFDLSLVRENGKWNYGVLSENHSRQLLRKTFEEIFNGDPLADRVVFYTVPLFSSLGFLVPTEGSRKQENGYYGSYSFYLTPDVPYNIGENIMDHNKMEELDNIASTRNDILKSMVAEFSEKGAELFDLDEQVRRIHLQSSISGEFEDCELYQGFDKLDFADPLYDFVDPVIKAAFEADSRCAYSLDGIHPGPLAHMMVALQRLQEDFTAGHFENCGGEVEFRKRVKVVSEKGSVSSRLFLEENPQTPGRAEGLVDTIKGAKIALEANKYIGNSPRERVKSARRAYKETLGSASRLAVGSSPQALT